ncbi:MAG: META domain-containing protein [Spirochaetaceae bacterium]|nr:META domain-containing protein [Spirochaetaceae bacterium]
MSKFRSCIFCFVVVLLAGGMMLTGCASSKGTVATDDAGIAGDWRLLSVLRNGSELAIPQGMTVTFSATVPEIGSYSYDVAGVAGVNNYGGPVTIDGTLYSGGPFWLTQMAGPSPLEDFERLYLETLTDADMFDISADGQGMEIAKSSGETALLFSKFKFDGSHWKLVAYFDGTGVRSVDQSKNVPDLSFGNKMDISGFSGSNFIVGDYTVDYTLRAISFQDIGTTRMAAPSGEAAVLEQVYTNLLNKTANYVWSGDELQLIGKDGTTLLVFAAK